MTSSIGRNCFSKSPSNKLTVTTVKPRFKTNPEIKTTPLLRPSVKSTISLISSLSNSIVRPSHYKDHFSSYKVVVLIAAFYCISPQSLYLRTTFLLIFKVYQKIQMHLPRLTMSTEGLFSLRP